MKTGVTGMNKKISQIISSALTVIAVAGTLMGIVGQGPLDGNLMGIFYAFAALGVLEVILQDYQLFPVSPAINVPSTRKFYHEAETITDNDCLATSQLFAPGMPKPGFDSVRVNLPYRQICKLQMVEGA